MQAYSVVQLSCTFMRFSYIVQAFDCKCPKNPLSIRKWKIWLYKRNCAMSWS